MSVTILYSFKSHLFTKTAQLLFLRVGENVWQSKAAYSMGQKANRKRKRWGLTIPQPR
jgi:hypothetical protein